MTQDINTLVQTAAQLRGRIIEHSGRTKTPHLGSCLSCADILSVYYFNILNIDPQNPEDENRDRFILSKGHAAPAIFQTLALKGFFPYQSLLDSRHDGTDYFGEHPPSPGHIPGIEAATGSLGHGFPMAVGMAIAAKTKGQSHRIDVILGDGECNEGSIWEAAMLTGAQKLDNLTIVVDFNKWQATDRSREVLALDPLVDKWTSFGWDACEIDGHDIVEIQKTLSTPHTGKPKAIIAHTVKGKGVSFMEDDNNWHYRTPTPEEVQTSYKELGLNEQGLPQQGEAA